MISPCTKKTTRIAQLNSTLKMITLRFAFVMPFSVAFIEKKNKKKVLKDFWKHFAIYKLYQNKTKSKTQPIEQYQVIN